MDLFTVAKKYYVGFTCHEYVTNDIASLESKTAKDYYKIIHIDSETCKIILNGEERILIGTNILLLNENDTIVLDNISNEHVTILYFIPSIINSKFDFELCNSTEALSLSENQDLHYLSKFKHDVTLQQKIFQCNAINSSIILQKLQQLSEELTLQNSSYWPCRSRSYLLEILFFITSPEENNETINPTQILPSFSKLTIDIIYYLHTNYYKKLTTDLIAQKFCTNRTTVLTDFKKSTGMTLNQYLTQLRIKISSTLLRDTELPVSEISERTGFNDVSYFSKTFKKETGYSPSDYRYINNHELQEGICKM